MTKRLRISTWLTAAAVLLGSNWCLAGAKVTWDVVMNMETEGAHMMGRGTTRSGEAMYFLWHLGEGRNGVQVLGNKSKVDVLKLMPPFNGTEGGHKPDNLLLVYLMFSEDGERVVVRGAVTRWGLVGDPPPWDYRLSSEDVDVRLEEGEAYPVFAGTNRDGEDVYLELSVRPKSGGPGYSSTGVPERVPVEFVYELWDKDGDEQPLHRLVRKIDVVVAESQKSQAVFEMPVVATDYDSSEIHLKVHLSDLDLYRRGGSKKLHAKGVFNVDRTLVLDIVPSGKPGVIQARRMVSSSYARSVTLRTGKRVRVRLPSNQDEYLPDNLTEVVIIRPLTNASLDRVH